MDIVAIVGVILAFSAIFLGNALEGGQVAALLDAPAFIIVVGGTLGAVVLQTPWLSLMRASRMFVWIVKPPALDVDKEIERLAAWAKTARREGLLGLENISQGLKDPFRRKGLELVVDGIDPHTIRRLLEVDSQARTDSDLAAANVFKSMGGYAPTIGILGAVIGLIQVLGNLADPNELGAGIATAFVATIYGVGFANLLFLPIADRLRTQVIRYAGADDMFIEGLIAIADGEHPRSVEMRLRGLVAGS
jgi:chemotaxis protein MotA